MKTPISDFIEEYKSKDPLRFHTPGHKGVGSLGYETEDITEIAGADSLYFASGIIEESEQNASKLFGSYKTFYSCEGSSLSIRAMLYLAMTNRKAQQGNFVLATRNAHSSFITASQLLGFDVEWIFGEKSYLSSDLTEEKLENVLRSVDILPFALYITSPDYLGNMLDIEALSRVCKKYGILLLVDNAHGAYLKFLTPSLHPLDLGADMCCDSAHKTLPVLTGGGYLHISKANPALAMGAKGALALFGSTSPSYLILNSLDRANAYLEKGYVQRLNNFVSLANDTKKHLRVSGFEVLVSEPLKLVIATKSIGYYGYELGSLLEKMNIYPEFYDRDFIVFMLSPEKPESLLALESALFSLERKPAIRENAPKVMQAKKLLTPREALFCQKEDVSIDDANGRILGASAISCPPAVSLVVCGEMISDDIISACKYYGIKSLTVIR